MTEAATPTNRMVHSNYSINLDVDEILQEYSVHTRTLQMNVTVICSGEKKVNNAQIFSNKK